MNSIVMYISYLNMLFNPFYLLEVVILNFMNLFFSCHIKMNLLCHDSLVNSVWQWWPWWPLPPWPW